MPLFINPLRRDSKANRQIEKNTHVTRVVCVDGEMVETMPIRDQIKADRYLNEQLPLVGGSRDGLTVARRFFVINNGRAILEHLTKKWRDKPTYELYRLKEDSFGQFVRPTNKFGI